MYSIMVMFADFDDNFRIITTMMFHHFY